MSVSDITTFFTTSTRSENDATNKIREQVLKIISNPPREYLDHTEYGNSWRIVHEAWKDGLSRIATEKHIPTYTSTQLKIRAGRKYNYDADVMYYNGSTLLATIKVEFKYGGYNISGLPQFLSLQAKISLFRVTYDTFWFDNYLDQYIACDSGITEAKPPRDLYLKSVTGTRYTITSFFAQLKEREMFFKQEKDSVVNASIKDYLERYGAELDIAAFSEKVKATQTDKMYLLWCDRTFHVDMLSEPEMSNMVYDSIKNGNVLQVKAGNTMYGLLLRWRNHKGILNPAWQISLHRSAAPALAPSST